MSLPVVRDELLTRLKTLHVPFVLSDIKALTHHPLPGLRTFGSVHVLGPRCRLVLEQCLVDLLDGSPRLHHAVRRVYRLTE